MRVLCCSVFLTSLILLACAHGQPAAADEGAAAAAVAAKTQRVSLFKNGYGYFVRKGQLPAEGAAAVITPLPVPVHGTFFVSGPTGLKQIVAGEGVQRSTRTVSSLDELLRANVGAEVEVLLEKGTLKGKLLVVPEVEARPPYAAVDTYAGESARYVLIEASDGVHAIAPHQIQHARFPKGQIATTWERSERAAELLLRFDASARGKEVELAYLQRGITWVPAYQVDILSGSKARVVMSAQIINEVEDLQGAEIDLITGTPNIRFSHVDSPIALGGLDRFVSSLSGYGRYDAVQSRGRRGEIMSQQVMSNMAYFDVVDEGFGDEEGEREDLFFYTLSGIDLAKGQCAHLTVVDAEVSYRSLYEWRVSGSGAGVSYYGEPSYEHVWHALELKNEGKIPWTTAAATSRKEGALLGQDMITFTPAGGRALLRVTRALDIPVQASETEVGRERAHRLWRSSRYDKVSVTGELKIDNRKREAITMRVEKEVAGTVSKISDKGTHKVVQEALHNVNPTTLLSWEVEVPAGGEMTLTFRYDTYVYN